VQQRQEPRPDDAVVAFVVHPAPELLRRHVGGSVKDAALITELLRMMARNEPAGSRGLGRLREPITEGESRVLRFLPTNLSAPEIARQLFVSVHTVRAHQQHLYRKLGAHCRSEAVERACALGLLAHAVS
jgi:LuxR family maltose regulon positive regulatory protein